MGTCKNHCHVDGETQKCESSCTRARSERVNVCVCVSAQQRPVKRCLNEVPVQQWWVVFDGHVICLFSPNGLFSWLRRGGVGGGRNKRGGGRKKNQEWVSKRGLIASHLFPFQPHQWAIKSSFLQLNQHLSAGLDHHCWLSAALWTSAVRASL